MSPHIKRKGKSRRPAVESLEGRALMAAVAFGPPTSSAPNLNPLGVMAGGDFNRDGKLDLVVGTRGTPDADGNSTTPGVVVLAGRGGGAFAKLGFAPTDFSPSAIAVGDYNRDGKLDLAISGFGGSGPITKGVEIMLGDGRGGFRREGDFAAGRKPVGVIMGDFNRDGKPDLAVADSGVYNGPSNSNAYGAVEILLGVGDGTFRAPKAYFAGIGPSAIVIGDLNGDGKVDLAVINDPEGSSPTTMPSKTQGVSLLMGRGDGTFGSPARYATANLPAAVTMGDVNGDGRPDLITAVMGTGFAESGGVSGRGTVEVRLNLGKGRFGNATSTRLNGEAVGLAAADFNGDGKRDILLATYLPMYDDFIIVGGVEVLTGDGRGKFGPSQFFSGGTDPGALAYADVNGDRKLDVITLDSIQPDDVGGSGTDQGVYTWLNKTKK